MCYHIYILYSKKWDLFYVGQTTDLDRRLFEHNQGMSTFTAQGLPWDLLWTTIKPTLKQATTLERKLKNLTKKRKIRFMTKYAEGLVDSALLNELFLTLFK